jgi:hypothetical protein
MTPLAWLLVGTIYALIVYGITRLVAGGRE